VLTSIEQSMVALWIDVMRFLPQLLLAILVLVAGWIIGRILGGIVCKMFVVLKLDHALDKAGVDTLSERAGYQFKPGHFVGGLVKWFVMIAFAVAALDILRLDVVNVFMRDVVLGYLPNVFAAVLIIFAAALIAKVADKSVVAAVKTGGGHNPILFGKLTYYMITSFGALAALSQLQIAEELVQTFFTGVMLAVSIAVGLAFGLGGKNAAAKFIEGHIENMHK